MPWARSRGILFDDLAVPAAEHAPDFLKRTRYCGVPLRLERFRFPKNREQDFYRVHFSYGQPDIGQLLLARQEARICDSFHHFNQDGIDTLSERVAMRLRD